jgi:hypothetical protein
MEAGTLHRQPLHRQPVHASHDDKAHARRDYTAWVVALCAALLSVAAYVITDRHGGVLLYKDTKSHLEIARRVISSTSPGLAQLGNVWLPLPHLLMLPLIWNNTLYHDGFAGSIVSMAAYVATAVLIYKTALVLTSRKIAGIVAAGVFALNVNMLYMQSTPMTEALLFCMIAATVYFVTQWAHTDQYRYLIAGGVAALLATLSRYESWPILGCLLVAVIIIAWQRSHGHDLTPKLRWARTQDRFIAFAVVAMAGIVAWVVWSWAIFGGPLSFQNGPYAKPALWVSNSEPAIGHWAVAAKTYWYAMADNETWPLLLIAAIGLVCFIALEWRTKRGAARSLPVLSLLVTVPFYIVSLYIGQRPLHVMQIHHDLYDVRFGLLMLVPTAIFIGYLVGSLRRFRLAMYAAGGLVLAVAVGLGALLLSQHDVMTYNEPARFGRVPDQVRVVTFLQGHYSGGRVLMESFGNEVVAFQVPSSQLVYEGSYGQWLPALQYPAASHISWIIARCGSKPDKVCSNVTTTRLSGYELVYRTPDRSYYVYRLRK